MIFARFLNEFMNESFYLMLLILCVYLGMLVACLYNGKYEIDFENAIKNMFLLWYDMSKLLFIFLFVANLHGF